MAKEYSYTVLVERDVESGDYIAYAPAFDGCVVQMKTYDEELAEIEEVLKDFIQGPSISCRTNTDRLMS